MKKASKQKIPWHQGVFCVDRGGVEPLEQVDESAPETLRTRPSYPQKYYIKFSQKEELPMGELFGNRTISIIADSSTLILL